MTSLKVSSMRLGISFESKGQLSYRQGFVLISISQGFMA